MTGKTHLRMLVSQIVFVASAVVAETCFLLAFLGIEVEIQRMWTIVGIAIICLALSLMSMTLSPDENQDTGETGHDRSNEQRLPDECAAESGKLAPRRNVLNERGPASAGLGRIKLRPAVDRRGR
jgi:hypothetical protein